MDEADYPGIRVSMVTKFDGAIIPFKVDISTGDIITPKEVRYQFKLMLEDRAVDIWTYNLETIMAEKFEMGLFWFIIVVCTFPVRFLFGLQLHQIKCWVHFSVNFCFLDATECVVLMSQLNFRAGIVEKGY